MNNKVFTSKRPENFHFQDIFSMSQNGNFYFFCATFSQLAQEIMNAVEHKNKKKLRNDNHVAGHCC